MFCFVGDCEEDCDEVGAVSGFPSGCDKIFFVCFYFFCWVGCYFFVCFLFKEDSDEFCVEFCCGYSEPVEVFRQRICELFGCCLVGSADFSSAAGDDEFVGECVECFF